MPHATTPLVTALARAVRRDRRKLARALALARKGDASGVHDSRVACRRLREALPLTALAGRDPRTTDRALRKLMKTFGPVREADVARLVLGETARTAGWPPSVVERVDRAIRKRRDRAWTSIPAALEAMDLDELLGDVDELGRALAHDASHTAVSRALAARVRQRAADVVAAIDQAGTLYLAGPLHAIRLAAKKLRYALELAGSARGWNAGPARRRLRGAQVMLGGLRDLQTAQTEIHRVAAHAATGRATLRTLDEMNRTLEAQCRATHADFLQAAPGLHALASGLARAVALRALKPRPARMSQASAGRAAGASGGRR